MSQIHHDPELALELFVLEPSRDSPHGEHEIEISDEPPDLH